MREADKNLRLHAHIATASSDSDFRPRQTSLDHDLQKDSKYSLTLPVATRLGDVPEHPYGLGTLLVYAMVVI